MKAKYLFSSASEPTVDWFEESETLDITEMFCDTIQGEGISIGMPATFLRLQGCTLDCVYCDTEWKAGKRFTFDEIFQKMEEPYYDLIEKFRKGQRLIFTGGSPLRQQGKLLSFILAFISRYDFKPDMELENECVLFPNNAVSRYIPQWNNSPKLWRSGMDRSDRYKPDVIKYMSSLGNSWFKFVIECEEDWEEIQVDFLDPGLIRKDQIILMPMATDLKELQKNRDLVVDMAIQKGVRYSTREQLILNKS